MEPRVVMVTGEMRVTVRRKELQLYMVCGDDGNGNEFEIKSNNEEYIRSAGQALRDRGFILKPNQYGGWLHTLVVDRLEPELVDTDTLRFRRAT